MLDAHRGDFWSFAKLNVGDCFMALFARFMHQMKSKHYMPYIQAGARPTITTPFVFLSMVLLHIVRAIRIERTFSGCFYVCKNHYKIISRGAELDFASRILRTQ